jgi:methanogenic corrinoid protein MtbC1
LAIDHDSPAANELRTVIRSSTEAREREIAVRAALSAVREGTVSIEDLYVDVLSPLLEDIGRSWAHGSERIWEEHYVSQTVRTIVESLYLVMREQASTVPRRGKLVLLACPPKEQHELGLRMLADRFELAGYGVVYLGADTPLAEIISAAQTTGADIVALSVSTVFERLDFRRFVDDLRAALPATRIVVGGPAFAKQEHWPAEDVLDTHELGLERLRQDG